MSSYEIHPVAFVRGGRKEAIDDNWGDVVATIEFVDPYTEESLLGLEDFSHIDVVFVFHGVDPESIHLAAVHPRENPEWPKVGIFSQRKRARPNRIGITTCELLERKKNCLIVRGLDAIDGTPVVDVKPFFTGFLPRQEIRQPEWALELMRDYWFSDGNDAPQ